MESRPEAHPSTYKERMRSELGMLVPPILEEAVTIIDSALEEDVGLSEETKASIKAVLTSYQPSDFIRRVMEVGFYFEQSDDIAKREENLRKDLTEVLLTEKIDEVVPFAERAQYAEFVEKASAKLITQ